MEEPTSEEMVSTTASRMGIVSIRLRLSQHAWFLVEPMGVSEFIRT